MRFFSFPLFVKGVVLGGSMTVPGVSGGTMALVMKIYHPLITAVNDFFKKPRISASLLFSVGLGGAFGVVFFSSMTAHLMERYPLLTAAFFIGVILGGVPTLVQPLQNSRLWQTVPAFILGAMTVAALDRCTGVPLWNSLRQPHGAWLWIPVGLAVALALVLPGISTSHMLLLMGLYTPTVRALQERQWLFLLCLLLSTGIGVLLITKPLDHMLTRYPVVSYAAILGFVLGSVIQLGSHAVPAVLAASPIMLAVAAALMGIGGIILYEIGHFSSKSSCYLREKSL